MHTHRTRRLASDNVNTTLLMLSLSTSKYPRCCVLNAGEGLSGALKWQDLHRIVAEIGFSEPRIKAASRITVENEQLQGIVGKTQLLVFAPKFFARGFDRLARCADACLDDGGRQPCCGRAVSERLVLSVYRLLSFIV